jgi:hypothetical protein
MPLEAPTRGDTIDDDSIAAVPLMVPLEALLDVTHTTIDLTLVVPLLAALLEVIRRLDNT